MALLLLSDGLGWERPGAWTSAQFSLGIAIGMYLVESRQDRNGRGSQEAFDSGASVV
ncbi:MAG TPA: hypothetical protein VK633_10400 [Verrucomicrobiae bacterium]|nr:hypothetical protein [Verrucomicrobiae bacterium]